MHCLLRSYLDELESAGNAKQLCQTLIRIAGGIDLPALAYIAIPSTADRQLRFRGTVTISISVTRRAIPSR